MNNKLLNIVICLLIATGFSFGADKPPRITHEPVKAGVKGQPVYIRATVLDDKGPAKEVNLYCSVSSDSAPFKVSMRASGAGSFIGTIPDSLVVNSTQVSYYIEAVDALDQSSETPWYSVKFTNAEPGGQIQPANERKETSTWRKPLMIAGGAALAVGAGFAVANSGSDDDDAPDPDGLFSGSANRYFQMQGGAATAETYTVVFNLIDGNKIATDDLHPGVHLESMLSGGSFTMTAQVNDPSMTGEVVYSGNMAGTKITGTISGSIVTTDGVNGTYSGIFSADKQQ